MHFRLVLMAVPTSALIFTLVNIVLMMWPSSSSLNDRLGIDDPSDTVDHVFLQSAPEQHPDRLSDVDEADLERLVWSLPTIEADDFRRGFRMCPNTRRPGGDEIRRAESDWQVEEIPAPPPGPAADERRRRGRRGRQRRGILNG